MFDSIILNHDKMVKLESFISDLRSSGNISMEMADSLDRIVPGVIASIDDDVMFDVDPGQEGFPIAMEAALSGLSKVQMAFIVAIIGFIAKYILSLKNTDVGFSVGGGGGWSGTAPPKLTINVPATDISAHTTIDDYIEGVGKDLDALIDEFTGFVKILEDKGDQVEPNSKDVRNLVDLVKGVLKHNSTGDGNVFFNDDKVDVTTYKKIVKNNDNNVSGNLYKSVVSALSSLAGTYGRNTIVRSLSSNNRLSIPYFILNNPASELAKNICEAANSAVDELLLIESNKGFNELREKYNSEFISNNIARMGDDSEPVYASATLKKVVNLLGSKITDASRDPVKHIALIERELKREISFSLTRVSDKLDDSSDVSEDIKNLSYTNEELNSILKLYTTSGMSSKIDQNLLSAVENSIKVVESVEPKLDPIRETQQRLVAASAMVLTDVDGKLSKEGLDVAKGNFKIVISYNNILLMLVAAVSKYNLSIDSSLKDRLEKVVRKYQMMATDYDKLNKHIHNIIKD